MKTRSPVHPKFAIAAKTAEKQMKALGVKESQSQSFILYRGGKRPGFRVTTIRLNDSMTMTKFIPE